ncbi:MAG: questin oxidase family protein [Actinobacteria bacterium]|nr:questin oxidase family protein [Actinomycetota bacterium]
MGRRGPGRGRRRARRYGERVTTGTLDRLLDEDLTTDPVTAGGLTNHRPMTLIALDALGADDRRLEQFSKGYASRLAPRRPPTGTAVTVSTLGSALGTGERFGDLVAYFGKEVDSAGVDATLGRHLGILLDGVGGAAFHGLIRLGYALEHGRDRDVAAGLAYLADSAQFVQVPPVTGGGGLGAAGLLAALRDHPRLRDRTFGATGFAHCFAEVAADPDFVELAARVEVDEHSLAELARLTHQLYRATGDFFELHTMTGTHAARLVLARTPTSERAGSLVAALVRAVGAAYVVIGTLAVDTVDDGASPPRGWPEISEALVASDDPHVIKLGYTCRQEEQAWSDSGYRATAAAVAGLTA